MTRINTDMRKPSNYWSWGDRIGVTVAVIWLSPVFLGVVSVAFLSITWRP